MHTLLPNVRQNRYLNHIFLTTFELVVGVIALIIGYDHLNNASCQEKMYLHVFLMVWSFIVLNALEAMISNYSSLNRPFWIDYIPLMKSIKTLKNKAFLKRNNFRHLNYLVLINGFLLIYYFPIAVTKLSMPLGEVHHDIIYFQYYFIAYVVLAFCYFILSLFFENKEVEYHRRGNKALKLSIKKVLTDFIFSISIFILLSYILNTLQLSFAAETVFSNESKTRVYTINSIITDTPIHKAYVPTIMGDSYSAFYLLNTISSHDLKKQPELTSALSYALIKNIDIIKNTELNSMHKTNNVHRAYQDVEYDQKLLSLLHLGELKQFESKIRESIVFEDSRPISERLKFPKNDAFFSRIMASKLHNAGLINIPNLNSLSTTTYQKHHGDSIEKLLDSYNFLSTATRIK